LKFHDVSDYINEASRHNRRQHDILRRPSTSTIPTPHELETLPLHCKSVNTMNISRARSLMSDSTKQQFDSLWSMLVHPEKYGCEPNNAVPKSRFLPKHATQLAEAGLVSPISDAELAARPTRGVVNVFTVKESKSEGDRLRPIGDPCEINAALHPHYQSNMNLKHVSAYTSAVAEEIACIGDLAISFFQVEIPHFARCNFRFRDSDGTMYEWNRMIMGHKVSAEIIQILTEVLAGVPRALKNAPIPSRQTSTHVWVDGFRVAGTRRRVQQACDDIVQRSNFVGATWKEDPLLSSEYDFDGVHFDHRTHTVRVADKTLAKIPRDAPKSARKSFYEALVARLIFVAGVLNIPLMSYYMLLKISNRYANSLNNGDHDCVVTFPEKIFPQLQQLVSAAFTNKFIAAASSTGHDVLYTDASTKGWGAFYIAPTQEVAIVGAPWPDSQAATSDNIAELEAIAVENAISCFSKRLSIRKNVELRVDNSSVSAALRRALAKAGSINDRLADSMKYLANNNFKYSVSLVKSSENLADAPSRGVNNIGAVVDFKTIYESRGGLGRLSVT
jgi:hypothetical protein